MPAGCDFICKNDSCEQEGKLIVVTAPWPMGDIKEVIESLQGQNYHALVNALEEKELNGAKYACIQIPNEDNIETLAYRISFWHPTQKMICEYYLELNGRSLEEALQDPKIPTVCPESGEKLIPFEEMIEEDFKCPHCEETMEQVRWLSYE